MDGQHVIWNFVNFFFVNFFSIFNGSISCCDYNVYGHSFGVDGIKIVQTSFFQPWKSFTNTTCINQHFFYVNEYGAFIIFSNLIKLICFIIYDTEI
jgi:hypothetical protein